MIILLVEFLIVYFLRVAYDIRNRQTVKKYVFIESNFLTELSFKNR